MTDPKREMNRPERPKKKRVRYLNDEKTQINMFDQQEYGYNRACIDHDKWLPKEEELVKIVDEFLGDSYKAKYIASAIAKRLQ